MIWTKTKPTMPGHYWLKMDEMGIVSSQAPRVVAVFFRDWNGEDELWALEAPDYEDGFAVAEMSEHFDWSSEPVALPNAKGNCSCHLYGNAACSSCDDTMPEPLVAP